MMYERERLAQILINSSRNEFGGIPIFLNVDNEEIVADLRKMHSFIVIGKNSDKSISEISSQINPQYIIWLNNLDDLIKLHDEVKYRFEHGEQYVPYQVVIIQDISFFKNDMQKIREIISKGTSVSLYFVCACKTDTEADKYNMLIPVKMYDNYTAETDMNNSKNLFTFVGTVRKISFK